MEDDGLLTPPIREAVSTLLEGDDF